MQLLTQFLERYPRVQVNLQLDDRVTDMVAENIDVSIRVGYLPDSTLIARKIGDLRGVLCASPDYLDNAPALETPTDLLHHRCLFYRNAKLTMNNWTFTGEQGDQTVKVSGPLTINDPGALVGAAIMHAGVLLTDQGLLGDIINVGLLTPVLEAYKVVGGLPIYIVYPEREFVPAKTRALVDFLLDEMPAVI